jgi:vacuolar protein sorting-associated protein 35
MQASRLFWIDSTFSRPEGKVALKDSKRMLECLQKSLKIADSVMDRAISVGLFVEILEQYLWFFEHRAEGVNDTLILR